MSGLTMEDWLKEIQDEKLKKVQQVSAIKEEKSTKIDKEKQGETFKISKDDL